MKSEKGIEVGQIFKLGTKYSSAMNCTYTDEFGANVPMVMGCYGIGLGRCLAAIVEQRHDENGIIWPMNIAPYKVAILPLNKKYHGEKARELYKNISFNFMTTYDEAGSIGKRYRRQDAIGTPFCITVDDETVNNGTVTVRNRDTMEQIVLKVEELENYIRENTKF